MNSDLIFGINEPKLDVLILDIADIAERVNQKLETYERLMTETHSFFDCESGEKYRRNFRLLSTTIPVIKKNILYYSNDLVNVKQRIYKNEATVNDSMHLERIRLIQYHNVDRYHGMRLVRRWNKNGNSNHRSNFYWI